MNLDMNLRTTFNEDVFNYDKMRPTYPPELFNDIFKFSNLDNSKSVLEIGIGTGQATLPFLEKGCHVTAVELGSSLAEFTKVKYSRFDNFNVINGNFENVILEDESFDLIYSATAFHWIPDESGYAKVKRLLKKGGTLALFWNHPTRSKDALYLDMEKVYEKHFPSKELIGGALHNFKEENCQKFVDKVSKFGFADVNYKLHSQTRIFNCDDYIALLMTYSDHRVFSKDKYNWALFENELRDVINLHGGKIDNIDIADLYLAKKL